MSNFKAQMSNQIQSTNDKKIFDLSERTAVYGENIIDFIKSIPDTVINRPLISQTIRSATSIGANYMEADGAESKKDFQHKIGICKKESKETMHWLRMLAKAYPRCELESRKHWKEAHELVLIFSSIINNSKK
jgi:four helix bundle protein